MIAFESHRCRRLLVRLDAPDRLRPSLLELAETHAIATAWVRGSGTVAWVEIARFDARSRGLRDSRRYEQAELVSLQGHLSLKDGSPYLTVRGAVRLSENGAVVGGVIADLGALATDVVLEVYDDVLLSLEPDPATGSDRWSLVTAEPGPEVPAAVPESGGGLSWASVAHASEQAVPAVRAGGKPRSRGAAGPKASA